MEEFGKFVLIVLLAIPTTLLGGVAIADMWEWFIVPIGVPVISIAQGIGISLLLGLMSPSRAGKEDDSGPFVMLLTRVFAVLAMWGMAAIVANFV